MNITIRDIGNSKGVILPSTALKQAGITDVADLSVAGDTIIIKAIQKPRHNWAEAINNDPADGDIFADNLHNEDNDWTW